MTDVVDFKEEKAKGTYQRWLREEALELEKWFRERGTDPERIYDILDAFRYIGLCATTYGLPDDDAEEARMVILDLIDDFRSKQSLPTFKMMHELKKSDVL